MRRVPTAGIIVPKGWARLIAAHSRGVDDIFDFLLGAKQACRPARRVRPAPNGSARARVLPGLAINSVGTTEVRRRLADVPSGCGEVHSYSRPVGRVPLDHPRRHGYTLVHWIGIGNGVPLSTREPDRS